MKTIQIIVQGRVQGVYFRAYTQKQAIKLGITGRVCNKDDGSVDIIAQAEQEKLDALIHWCHKGSLLAKVSDVAVCIYDGSELFSSFDIV